MTFFFFSLITRVEPYELRRGTGATQPTYTGSLL